MTQFVLQPASANVVTEGLHLEYEGEPAKPWRRRVNANKDVRVRVEARRRELCGGTGVGVRPKIEMLKQLSTGAGRRKERRRSSTAERNDGRPSTNQAAHTITRTDSRYQQHGGGGGGDRRAHAHETRVCVSFFFFL